MKKADEETRVREQENITYGILEITFLAGFAL